MGELALNFSVRKGQFSLSIDDSISLQGITAVFGPSGSGKTTLLRVIAGLERNARGQVALSDTVWQDEHTMLPAHRRQVAYVFQDARLFPHLSVRDNLLFARRHSTRDASIELDDVVAVLELESLLSRRPESLSGGEQQRVAIGRALLTSPRLLLMDEPLSSLDAGRKREIIRYIEELPQAFRLPVLYVTHSIDEATRLADKMLLLAEGRVIAHGDITEMLQRIDLWPFTGRLEAGSLLQATITEHVGGMTVLRIDDQSLRIPAINTSTGAEIRLKINARDVVIATQKPSHLSIRNVLAAQIDSIVVDTSIYAELLLNIGAQQLRARITQEAVDELALIEGQKIYALIKSVLFEDHLL